MISIYKITHKESGKCYIGQAVDVTERWKEHCYPSSECKKIRNAIQKYGKDAFTFEVVLEVPQEEVDYYETLIIALNDSVENGYNICYQGHSRRGTKHSDETKKKLSEAMSGESNPNSKLSNRERLEIVDLYKNFTQKQIAEFYGVTQRAIGKILKNKTAI